MLVSSVPEALDPRFAMSAVAGNISRLLYSPLFELRDDLVPYPFLAERYDQPNELTYIVTLKDNIFFHNAKRIRSEDVVYTFSTLSSEDVHSPHESKFKYLESVVALDPETIQFTLKEPFAPFLTDLASIAIVSKEQCFERSQKCKDEQNYSQ
jgi:ABC-type transport system substrate-binding protein